MTKGKKFRRNASAPPNPATKSTSLADLTVRFQSLCREAHSKYEMVQKIGRLKPKLQQDIDHCINVICSSPVSAETCRQMFCLDGLMGCYLRTANDKNSEYWMPVISDVEIMPNSSNLSFSIPEMALPVVESSLETLHASQLPPNISLSHSRDILIDEAIVIALSEPIIVPIPSHIDDILTNEVVFVADVMSSLSVSSFSPPASPVTCDVTVPSHPAEDGEEVVNGHVVGSELHEHEQPPHPTPKVISPEDERPLVVDPSLVADSYLSPCAEPISSLVNHTTEPFTMSDDGVRMSAVPSHPASLVTCDLMGPLVVGPSLQFALVATGELETLPSSASSPPNTPLNNNNNNNNNNELTDTNEFSSNSSSMVIPSSLSNGARSFRPFTDCFNSDEVEPTIRVISPIIINHRGETIAGNRIFTSPKLSSSSYAR